MGHALYTPKEDFGSAPKDFVNVLEDVRVERKMKVTYPGLKKSFYKGYTELMGRNFFGVDGRDLTTLSLIDRINLFFKIGSFTEIPFKEDEKVWLQRAVKTVTFRDVVDLSIELYEFMKSQKSDDKEDMPEMPLPQNGNQSAEAEQQPLAVLHPIVKEKRRRNGLPILIPKLIIVLIATPKRTPI